MSCTFMVYGEPKGKPSARAVVRNGRAGTYTPSTAGEWMQAVVLAARDAGLGVAPIDGALAVAIDVYMPRPKSLMRKKDPEHEIVCRTKPDADNLAKAILDALTTAGVWIDDAQVVELHVHKWYVAKGMRPGASISLDERVA